MVLWNIKFKTEGEAIEAKKAFKNLGLYFGEGNMGEVSGGIPPIDKKCLILNAENDQQILSTLKELGLEAEIISR